MTRRATSRKQVKGKRNLDPFSTVAVGQATGLDKALLGKRGFGEIGRALQGKRNTAYRRNSEDIELLNDLAPAASVGHIEFTQDGIERYIRDGYVYQAFTATPVFEDGYRSGAVESTVNDFAMQNPAKYEWCVRAVQKRGGANAYAVCTAQGLRNPEIRRYYYNEMPVATTADAQRLKQVAISEGWSQLKVVKGLNGWGYALVGKHPKHDEIEAGYRLTDLEKEIADQRRKVQALDRSGSFDALRLATNKLDKLEAEQRKLSKKYRKNPASGADAAYEEFHGVPPTETLEVHETLHVHEHLGGLADLCHIVVRLSAGTKVGKEVQLDAPDPTKADDADIVRLAVSEDKNTIYFVGGDQRLDLEALGFRKSFTITHDGESFDATDIKDNMIIGLICRIMYRTEKEFDDFETIDYHHLHGEDTSKYPTLTYDSMNNLMGVFGGEYAVHAAGIVN